MISAWRDRLKPKAQRSARRQRHCRALPLFALVVAFMACAGTRASADATSQLIQENAKLFQQNIRLKIELARIKAELAAERTTNKLNNQRIQQLMRQLMNKPPVFNPPAAPWRPGAPINNGNVTGNTGILNTGPPAVAALTMPTKTMAPLSTQLLPGPATALLFVTGGRGPYTVPKKPHVKVVLGQISRDGLGDRASTPAATFTIRDQMIFGQVMPGGQAKVVDGTLRYGLLRAVDPAGKAVASFQFLAPKSVAYKLVPPPAAPFFQPFHPVDPNFGPPLPAKLRGLVRLHVYPPFGWKIVGANGTRSCVMERHKTMVQIHYLPRSNSVICTWQPQYTAAIKKAFSLARKIQIRRNRLQFVQGSPLQTDPTDPNGTQDAENQRSAHLARLNVSLRERLREYQLNKQRVRDLTAMKSFFVVVRLVNGVTLAQVDIVMPKRR